GPAQPPGADAVLAGPGPPAAGRPGQGGLLRRPVQAGRGGIRLEATAMSTTLPADPRPFRRRWADFWFSRTDPTTLGFIRVVTGMLILYTHAVYIVDLQPFFGKTGWYGAKQIDEERR